MKTVSEIAKLFDVSADTIRHYTKIGVLVPVRDKHNGYRLYGAEQEKRLRFLMLAKKLGYSLKDINQILNASSAGDQVCSVVRNLMSQRLKIVRQRANEMRTLLCNMEHASNLWSELPDRPPEEGTICYLIENWHCGSDCDYFLSDTDLDQVVGEKCYGQV